MHTGRDAPKAAARAGLVARGVLYCAAAVLGLRVVSARRERVDKEGAIQGVAAPSLSAPRSSRCC